MDRTRRFQTEPVPARFLASSKSFLAVSFRERRTGRYEKILREKPTSMTVKSLLSLAVLILMGLCTANAQVKPKKPGECPGKNGLTASEIGSLLAAHNKVRAEHHLSPLTWSCKLADYAQEWATHGVFEHRKGTTFGESLFVATNSKIAAGASVQQWLSEKPFWNNQTALCQTGKICGHYTQLVWRKTTEVGCGVNRKTPGDFKVLLVCSYSLAGNSGGLPY
jgi:hypothetical protein